MGSPARAEVTLSSLAEKIERLETENRQMRQEIARMRQAGEKPTKSRASASTTFQPGNSPRAKGDRQKVDPSSIVLTGTARQDLVGVHPGRGAIELGNVEITPGGFLAAEGIFRTRALQADIATPFAALPTSNLSFAHTNEFRYTSRQSRATVLAQIPLTPSTLFSAYTEVDFLGAAGTANDIESNSYNPRLRVLYGTVDNDSSGFHALVGQNWTLATTNSRGILPRDEALPPTIDEQFVPGFVWLRQPQVRLVKDFDKKLWFALSAEQPQTTFEGSSCTTGSGATTIGNPANTGVAAITCQVLPQGSGGFNNVNTPYSLNHVPDVIGKVALDSTVFEHPVHVEGIGLYRDLFDRVTASDGTSTNHNRAGYGVGGGLVASLLPNRLSIQVSGLIGRGLGRYGTSTLADATFAQDGAARPIPEAMVLAGLTAHVTPSLDIYLYAGMERQWATYFANGPNSFFGVGIPNVDNSGCNTELSTACSTMTKATKELTVGFWDDIYKGRYGQLRGGLQYGYAIRDIFPSTFNGQYYAPKANDNLLYTSLRYFPFD